MKFYVLANWMQGDELSGGDNIFIQLCKRIKSVYPVHILVSHDGWKICEREGLKDYEHSIWVSDCFNKFGYLVNYLYRTAKSLSMAFSLKLNDSDIVYSSSDFWPDSLSGAVLKLRNRRIKWLAGFYLFAPAPFAGDNPYKGSRFLIGLFYWLTQKPVYHIIKRFADYVMITSEPDIRKFASVNRNADSVIVVKGGLDLDLPNKYLESAGDDINSGKVYDACFLGRFHYQKGLLELIDIWRIVVSSRAGAKLVLIGSGPMQAKIEKKISEYALKDNVVIAGFRVGNEKYEIFKKSRIVVHPATYDSGGMAAIDAMSWGLPGVSFDLESLKTYYPEGMLKTPCFDRGKFARNIIGLLNDDLLYRNTRNRAIALAQTWNWDVRAAELMKKINKSAKER